MGGRPLAPSRDDDGRRHAGHAGVLELLLERLLERGTHLRVEPAHRLLLLLRVGRAAAARLEYEEREPCTGYGQPARHGYRRAQSKWLRKPWLMAPLPNWRSRRGPLPLLRRRNAPSSEL